MMPRLLLPFICALLAVQASAVNLRVHGTVTDLISRAPLQGVEVRVYKDGMKQHRLTSSSNGSYSVVLDNNAQYVIRFIMAGRVTKCFAVNTEGGTWENDKSIMDIEVEMTLFPSVEGMDMSWFDLPMGMARFQPMTGHVAWSADYERRIRGEADRLTAWVIQQYSEVAARADAVQVPRSH